MAKSLEDHTLPELMEYAKKLEQQNAMFSPVLNSPATRTDALKLMKKANPSAVIPELELEDRNAAALAEERKAREALEAKVRDGEIRERLREERARVARQYDLTESEVLEVEKLMVDEKAPIPHYDAAAKVYKASRVQATPTSAALVAKTYDMPAKDKWGAGVGNKAALQKAFTNEAYAVLNELRGGKAA